jgi:hypothetical protein
MISHLRFPRSRNHHLTALFAAIALGAGIGIPSGITDSAPPVSEIVIESVASGLTSTLTVDLDEPVEAEEAEEIALELADQPLVQSLSSKGSAGSPIVLLCNSYRSWSDANGRFTLQRACGGTTAPWGFKLSATVASSVVGYVREGGMSWTKNGVSQSRQAGHVELPSYQFHGSFSGLTGARDRVVWYDVLSWKHNLAGGGNATLTVSGAFDTRRYA